MEKQTLDQSLNKEIQDLKKQLKKTLQENMELKTEKIQSTLDNRPKYGLFYSNIDDEEQGFISLLEPIDELKKLSVGSKLYFNFSDNELKSWFSEVSEIANKLKG